MSKKIIAIAGATGTLGQLIIRELLKKDNVQVRALVRAGSESKLGDLAARIETVEGDLQTAADSVLDAFTNGAFAVVSAVQGGQEVIVDAPLRLFDAAMRQGVRRFIPSDFSFDGTRLQPGENFNADLRRAFFETAQSKNTPVELVRVMNGCFTDAPVLFGFLGAFDLQAGKAFVWGDTEAKIDFTTYADTAAYTAEAALYDGALPQNLKVAGDEKTIYEVIAAYEKHTGRKLEVVNLGSFEDMGNRIRHLVTTEPHNFYGYLPLMYYKPMLEGRTKMQELHNHLFPGVKPVTVEQFIQSTF